MSQANVPLFAFNRGLFTKLGLARTDIPRLALSSVEQNNYIARAWGSMMLRPGWKHLGSTASDAKAFFIPFVFSTSDKASVEITDENMRVWVDDALVTRPAVTSAVTNGGFNADVASWTDNDEAGGTSDWVTDGKKLFRALQFDDSGSSFVDETTDANSATASDWAFFPAGAGVDDYVAFGSLTTFTQLRINVGTVGTGTYTTTWEYWNGTAWTALTGLTDGTTDFKTSGINAVTYTFPTDWATTSLNGSPPLYFIRAKRDAGTVTADPLGTQGWTGGAGGYLRLVGNGTAAAIRDQQVTVAGADQNVEHALRIIVERGTVVLRVGSSSGDDDYISETSLRTGEHSLAFTPTGDFYIRFLSRFKREVLVDSCNVEASGVMSVPAPWAEADLGSIRFDQSADVLFLSCDGYQQRRIERRATRSWSVVLYQPNDGPFRVENTGPITMTPAALSGNTTLTSSADYFRSGHVGALFRVTSSGQNVTASVTAENQFTNVIKVTGVGTQRIFQVTRSGTWVATVTLQRSLTSDTGPWEDVTTYTTNGSVAFDDGFDNQIAWYRIGVKTGDFTSGTVELDLDYNIGSVDGLCRVTNFTGPTIVDVEVISDFGGTDATEIWAEGSWSTLRGFPTAVTFVEGRLGWFGRNGIFLSITDAYESFDDTVEGDSAPINRTIGSGPVDKVPWAMALQRLLVGAEGAEWSIRASGFDEPLSITEFTIRPASTQGSADVAAVKLDSGAMFLQQSGSKVYELAFSLQDNDYIPIPVNIHVPEVGEPSIIKMAIQRQPDTRIHCVRSDGKVAVLLVEKVEDLKCWTTVDTDGLIEDVVILPGDLEDEVYYVVNRTINGATKRFYEKWAMENQANGGTTEYRGVSATVLDADYPDGTVVTVRDINGDKIENLTVSAKQITLTTAATYVDITPSAYRLADSYVTYSGASTTTITGLTHLEGESVVVFADGKQQANQTVASGQITIAEAAEEVIVGLYYKARFKSTKLAYAAEFGTGLSQRGVLRQLGLIMASVHAQGIKYGPTFDNMNSLPLVEGGKIVDPDYVWQEHDKDMMSVIGEWSTDSRLCLESESPKPCTVMAAIIGIEKHDKT